MPVVEIPIAHEHAYALICQFSDDGFNNAVSARGWLNYSSYMIGEYMRLTDNRIIYRQWTGLVIRSLTK